jgi:hypothetical protein
MVMCSNDRLHQNIVRIFHTCRPYPGLLQVEVEMTQFDCRGGDDQAPAHDIEQMTEDRGVDGGGTDS